MVQQDMKWVLQRKKSAAQLKAGKYLQIWGGVNAFFVNRSGTDGAGAKKDFQAVGINFTF